MKKLNLKVGGMTCSSCEVIIERNLRKVSGVEKVKASKSKDSVDVECSDQVQVSELQAAVKDNGYTLSLSGSGDGASRNEFANTNNWFSKNKDRFSQIKCILEQGIFNSLELSSKLNMSLIRTQVLLKKGFDKGMWIRRWNGIVML